MLEKCVWHSQLAEIGGMGRALVGLRFAAAGCGSTDHRASLTSRAARERALRVLLGSSVPCARTSLKRAALQRRQQKRLEREAAAAATAKQGGAV